MNENWSVPTRIDKKVESNYQGHGIYQILIYKNDKPISISRLQGKDCNGILSIGKSVNIEKRRNKFYRTSIGKRKLGHSEARTWLIIKRLSHDLFDSHSLMFTFKKTGQGEEIDEERDELRKYFTKFLELPPLNHQFPERMKWYHELK